MTSFLDWLDSVAAWMAFGYCARDAWERRKGRH